MQISSLQNERLHKFNEVRLSVIGGVNRLYLYGSKALKKRYDNFDNKKLPEIYHIEYEPNPFQFQYDLELYIFLNYDDLKREEMEMSDDISTIANYGATLLPRERHLANAASIRWPEKILPSGAAVTELAITPWLMDSFYGISNYQNLIMFGGGGQGKTYGSLAFMCMLYDNFIYTKVGAQCTISTVSKTKLESSSWAYINKLYNIERNYNFSLYSNRAFSSSDFTFRRKGTDGKFIKEGGTIKGVLLQRGVKDSRVVDKLTGCHDPIARCYLLDEAQSTDSAPMEAYTNMFLHPLYKWFIMSGNFDYPEDLLGVNVVPNTLWDGINEETHMWEGTIKSLEQNLGKKSLVIHFNNDLSPAITDEKIKKKYGRFMPTIEKKNELYPTDESRKNIAFKRMWIGFRYTKEERKDSIPIITKELLIDSLADRPSEYKPILNVGSFDNAPTGTDRNIFTTFSLGVDKYGYPVVWPSGIDSIEKPKSPLDYYRFTTDAINSIVKKRRIAHNHMIMDFTQITALVEMLTKYGIHCHQLMYQQPPPSKRWKNDLTGAWEDPVFIRPLNNIQRNGEEIVVPHLASDFIINRITMGAYAFRWFIEEGRVRGINERFLSNMKDNNGFEKEFLYRSFIFIDRSNGRVKLSLDKKDFFRRKYKFSPDILDNFFQIFYMLYCIFKVDPTKKGLGLLEIKEEEKEVDNPIDIWEHAKSLF